MTKADLITKVAEEAGISKVAAGKALNSITEAIKAEVVAGNAVQLIGFGTFTTVKRAARQGVNPATGEKIKIAASVTPKFKASKTFKEAVNVKPSKKAHKTKK